MSGSHRGQRSARNAITGRFACATGIGVLSLAVAAGIYFGLTEQDFYIQEGEQDTADYATYTADQITKRCIVLPTGRKKAQCVRDAIPEYYERSNQRRHDARDLVAQKTSALWTKIMGVGALLGLLLSIIGVVLVYFTFRAQKAALQQAEKNALDASHDTARAITEAARSADAMDRAANAMRSAALAGRIANEIAQVTQHAELRPYIGLESHPTRAEGNLS